MMITGHSPFPEATKSHLVSPQIGPLNCQFTTGAAKVA